MAYLDSLISARDYTSTSPAIILAMQFLKRQHMRADRQAPHYVGKGM